MSCHVRFQLSLILLLLVGTTCFADPREPKEFPAVEAAVNASITRGDIPGAVVLVGHDGKVVYRRAFGSRSVEPTPEPMTTDTIFDVSSLTKVVATAPAIMRMVSLGQLRLNDPVVRYLPEFNGPGKQDITIRMLLTHFSGLPPDLDLSQPWQGREEGARRALAEPLIHPPGARFVYSDINFILLGLIVERLSGMPLEKYAEAHIFRALKLAHTRFLPPKEWLAEVAPTEYDEHNVMLHGVVHDPTARRMGGVAGHAGVFSTADDLAVFAQAMLDGDKILSPAIIEKMTTPQQPANSIVLRGLGWDIDSPFSSNRGELLPVGSYGHTGFAGASLWIDSSTNTYIIILSNSVHPRNRGRGLVSLRTEIATAVADELKLHLSDSAKARLETITGYNETIAGMRRLSDRNGAVLTGIDVLEAVNFKSLQSSDDNKKPLRIGLLANQTGVDSQGRRTIDVLATAPGIALQAIFSPEHGIAGQLDSTDVPNSQDPTTRVPIYSVYGATDAQRRPPPEILKNLDAVVVDLQDAGARFYTYETTVGYFLEAAAKANIKVIVLDRPDPINGAYVEGPLSQSSLSNFVNYFPLPVRHGMTLGELARLFNEERHLQASLTVIAMQGWQRGDWLDATLVPWVDPSPNLRSLNQATLYPGVALVEGTNLSVGRGTDTPFELLGAPWINARELADYLNRREIDGVRFVPRSFIPQSGPYAGQPCAGINLIVTERNQLDSPELGIELASALLKLYPKDYKIERMIEILANLEVFNAIVAGEDPRRIAQDWQPQLDEFLKVRARYLLY